MLFNSIEFAIFLPVVFLLYWFIANQNLKVQNLLIVVAGYIFYGWWDWRFLIPSPLAVWWILGPDWPWQTITSHGSIASMDDRGVSESDAYITYW